MTLRVTLLEDALLAESIEIRQFGNRFPRLLIQIAHPAFLSPAFGKLLRYPHAFRQLGGHLIDGFAFETRFDCLVGKDDIGHIAAGGVQREVHLLRGGTVRQQNIGVFRRRRHVAVDDHDHFALLIVLQDFVGAVDLGVLVDKAVPRVVPDHLDRHVELIFAAYAITQRGHFRTTFNRVGPHKHRDAGLYRVFQRRHALERQAI